MDEVFARHTCRIGALERREGRAALEETPMNTTDDKFLWQMIELAWAKTEGEPARPDGAPGPIRAAILAGDVEDYDAALAPFCWALEDVLGELLTRDGLVTFARAFEATLFSLDRQVLAERVDLGDDGFLDARGFIVAMGKDYCTRVLARPESALPRAAVEQVYMSVIRAYEQRYKEPFPRFGIAVSTASNLDYWPEKRARVLARSRLDGIADEFALSLGLADAHTPAARLVALPALSLEELEDVFLWIAARIRKRRAES
jgi:hypothetical protein